MSRALPPPTPIPTATPTGRRLAAVLAVVILAGPAPAQTEEEIAFARSLLERLQIRSIIENREYCGYIGRDHRGGLVASKPRRGKYNSCDIGSPPPLMRVIASYHTHAGFDADHINEIPSLQDLTSDIEARTDGYVSTPGGRLWFSDHAAQEVRQICGPGCLPQDPVFRPGKAEKVRRSYSLRELERLMGP
ncbi:MAG: DUF4329 domain-containing protein [Rhodobacteraceae bacterium]|nr:DUF4329 domain-containing protein [Paracoccaceae bacterium]